MALEPLLVTLRNNKEVEGAKLGGKEHKIAAYADDILMYVSNPRVSLPNILKEIKKYGELSNFKINPIKTEILNIGLEEKEVQFLQKEFPFTWVKELNYLGIKITPRVEKIYQANFIPLINEVKEEMKKLRIQPLSWIGRINMFKMTILPKINYRLQMLPVKIPQSFFKIIKTILLKYIWLNKKPRIKYTLITRKKEHGGLAVPDISRYYKAIVLTRMLEWTNKKNEKKWVEMENTISGATLHKNIWIPRKYRILDTDTHEITKNVFKIWDTIHLKNEWKYNSPLLALTGSNLFTPGREIFEIQGIGNPRLKDITRNGKIRTRVEIEERNGWKMNEWNYIQIRHLVSTIPHPLRDETKLTALEKLCSNETPLKNGTSKIYSILTDLEAQERPEYINQWEKEMNLKIDNQKVEKMIEMGYNKAWDMKTIEMNYKLVSRWYMTPVRIHRFHQDRTSLCWRKCGQIATIIHIWWECPIIMEYWKEVLNNIKEITGEEIEQNIWTCLFHIYNKPKKQYRKSIIPNLLNAAKALIPKNWLKSGKPDIRNWLKEIDYHYKMEGGEKGDNSRWESWKNYKVSDIYLDRIKERTGAEPSG